MKLFSAIFLAVALAATARNGAGASATNTDSGTLATNPLLARGKGLEIRQSDVDQVLATYIAKNPEERIRQDARASILSRLIELQLVYQKATEAEKAAGWQYASEHYTNILKTLGAAEVERRLKVTHMTAEDLRRSLALEATTRKSLTRQLGITVTEADLKQYYIDEPAASEQPEKARIRELLLATTVGTSSQPLPKETRQAKHEQIYALLKRIRAGEDFAALAKQYNEDFLSTNTGGILPPFQATMVEYGDLALSMHTNEISNVLTNEDGYRIFQLLEKIPAKKLEYAAVTNKMRNYIIAGRTQDLAPAYIQRLRTEAGVEIVDAGLKEQFAEAEARAAEDAKRQAVYQAMIAPRITNSPPAKP